MVPIPERVTPQRQRRHITQSGFFRSEPPQRPRITYGRKDTKLLSLTANQFRPDTYAIPSDDENGLAASDALLQAAEREGGSDDDPELSDAERPELHILQINDNPRAVTPIRRQPGARESRAKQLTTATSEKPAPQTKARVPSKKSSKGKLSTPARRLPAKELFLVTSPVNYAQDVQPASTYHGVQSHDPINDRSSSQRKRSISPIGLDDGEIPRRASKAPLTAIRKRLQTPKSRHKSLKRRTAERSSWSRNVEEPKGRDGFEKAELAIPLHMKVQRRRKPKAPLVLGFGALQLKSGPLPEVEFEPSAAELKMETQQGGEGVAFPDNEGNGLVAPTTDSTQRSRQRVSFSDRVREDLIRAQLSSISAPERVPSESEESDADDDEEGGAEDEDGSVWQEDGSAVGDNEDAENQQLDKQEQASLGVSLDFRRASIPGRVPSGSFRRRRALIEVNEAIVEVPDTARDHEQMEYTLQRQEEPAILNSGRSRQHRPRSILKHSTQLVTNSTIRPEETAANTRRNSLIEIGESRYFTDAANALRAPDPARHQIVPRRRSSYFDHREVEVLDSDRIVPETSPEPPDYTNASDLSVLRGSSEAARISSSLPRVTKDLKTLTRSVSREYGTVSQSVRRKPSLPFQSPAKVRRVIEQ